MTDWKQRALRTQEELARALSKLATTEQVYSGNLRHQIRRAEQAEADKERLREAHDHQMAANHEARDKLEQAEARLKGWVHEHGLAKQALAEAEAREAKAQEFIDAAADYLVNRPADCEWARADAVKKLNAYRSLSDNPDREDG